MDDDLSERIAAVYRKRARNYDILANLYYLLGYREWNYRRLTVDSLGLKRGDTVVELGCGTGLNFSLYQEKIGAEGQIIGVDITGAMLDQARRRVQRNHWTNVTLVHENAVRYAFPDDIHGIVSTYALSLIPEAPAVIRRGSSALASGGRFSILELKAPESWPSWMVSVAMLLIRPFLIADEWYARKPWKAILQAMRGTLTDVSIEEFYLGTTYLISGRARAA
jgi:demethylmenaquinone methyltransferase/2-methoxy-6-polyprenyl-1,4-benzoquinol methylase